MRRAFLALVTLCGAVVAQVATNDDGSVVLLSNSWKLTAELPPGQSVFRSLDSGRTWESLASAGSTSDASSPFVTGDGKTFAWERSTRCFGSCMFALPRSSTEVLGLTGTVRINPYMLRVSHNGQWVLTPGFNGLNEYAMQDLQSGAVHSAEGGSPRLMVVSRPADDGTVLGLLAERKDGIITKPVEPKRLVAWKPGMPATRELLSGQEVYSAAVTPDRSRAAVWTPTELLLIDVASGGVLESLGRSSPGAVHFADISASGTRVLFNNDAEPGRLWIWEAGSGVRLLASVPETFSSAAISGDGCLAWVLTASGSLLRAVLDEDRAETVLEPVPLQLSALTYGSVPGSAVLFRAFGPVQTDGLVAEAGGFRFPVIATSEPDTVNLQVPWEFPATTEGTVLLKVSRTSSPFFLEQNLYIYSKVQPSFAYQPFANGRNYIKAVKADFGSLVTAETPALPGETIHVYLLGLGPLDRAVPTGVPGPADPPAHPMAPLACYLLGLDGTPPARGLVVPFVAYAPGLIGVYQVDMTIPEDWPAGDTYALCQTDAGVSGAYGVLPVGKSR